MLNLFRKTKKKLINLLPLPYNSETEFEKIIFETSGILADIFPIKRQIRGGNKTGIPDIIGIDISNGNVCIIEMKNETVDAAIIPQVLKYAIWADTNPDSIKNLWLECNDKNKPEDLNINWEELKVKIVIIAPDILRTTLDSVSRINYPVDLIEVKRWKDKNDSILIFNKLEQEKKIKTSPISGLETYDKAFYKRQYNSESAVEFLRYVKEVEGIIKKKKWSLETKYNKYYCGFKVGFFNAFGIKWMGSKTFAFFFKLSESEAKKVGIKMTKYDKLWGDALYYIEPNKPKPRTKAFIPLFKIAYKKIVE